MIASNCSNSGMLSHSFAGQLLVDASKQRGPDSVEHDEDAVAGHAKAMGDVGDLGVLAVAQIEDFAAAAVDFLQTSSQRAAARLDFGFDATKGVFELHQRGFAKNQTVAGARAIILQNSIASDAEGPGDERAAAIEGRKFFGDDLSYFLNDVFGVVHIDHVGGDVRGNDR